MSEYITLIVFLAVVGIVVTIYLTFFTEQEKIIHKIQIYESHESYDEGHSFHGRSKCSL